MSLFIKDPEAVLDYKFDWASWLASGETITDAVVTEDSGIVKDSDSITDSATSVTVWLSGGTLDDEYDILCHITTSDGREDDRTITVKMKNK